MFICPKSGSRLIKARVKGGMFWFSPETDGRLLSLHTIKHFLGEDASQEVWMRSENSPEGHVSCPGCHRKMVEVKVPQWIGEHPVDVCRTCWMVWLDANEYPIIPLGSEIDENVINIKKRSSLIESEVIALENQKIDPAPESLIHRLPAFLSLPVKSSSVGLPVKTLMIIVFALILIKHLSFAPGLGAVFYVLSLYFFYLFSSDVEIELGHLTYAILTLGSLGVSFSFAHWLGHEIHYFDLIALNYAMMSFSLLFPIQARYSYLIPFVHYLDLSSRNPGSLRVPAGFTFIRAQRWISVPQWSVIFVYLGISYLFLSYDPGLREFGYFKSLVLIQALWGLAFRAALYIRKPYNRL